MRNPIQLFLTLWLFSFPQSLNSYPTKDTSLRRLSLFLTFLLYLWSYPLPLSILLSQFSSQNLTSTYYYVSRCITPRSSPQLKRLRSFASANYAYVYRYYYYYLIQQNVVPYSLSLTLYLYKDQTISSSHIYYYHIYMSLPFWIFDTRCLTYISPYD